MNEILFDGRLALTLRLTVGFVFLFASSMKVRDLKGFSLALVAYGVESRFKRSMLAYAIPAVEIVVAAALLLGVLTVQASILASVLLLAFIGAMVVTMKRGSKVSCACFGGFLHEEIGWPTVARNVLLVLSAATIALSEQDYVQLQPLLDGRESAHIAIKELVPLVLVVIPILLAVQLMTTSLSLWPSGSSSD